MPIGFTAAQLAEANLRLPARLAALDTDIPLLATAAVRLTGRHAFCAACALDEAVQERALVRRQIQATEGVTP